MRSFRSKLDQWIDEATPPSHNPSDLLSFKNEEEKQDLHGEIVDQKRAIISKNFFYKIFLLLLFTGVIGGVFLIIFAILKAGY